MAEILNMRFQTVLAMAPILIIFSAKKMRGNPDREPIPVHLQLIPQFYNVSALSHHSDNEHR